MNGKEISLIAAGVISLLFFFFLGFLLIFCLRRRKQRIEIIENIFAKLPSSTPITRTSSWSNDSNEGKSRSTGHSPAGTPRGCIKFSLPQPPSKNWNQDLGQLNPEIYKNINGLGDLDSACPGMGLIDFVISPTSAPDEIIITIQKVVDIPAFQILDWKQERPNIFVKIYLLPSDKVFQTKTKKNTLSPVFNESFNVKISKGAVIRLSVYNIDKRNLRQSLGHVQVKADSVNLTTSTTHQKQLSKLSDMLNIQAGELELALAYIHDPGKLKVDIMGCHNLPTFMLSTEEEECELFIRVQLLLGRKIMKVKETASHKTQMNCIKSSVNLDEVLLFNLSPKSVDMAHISCSLMRRVNRPGQSEKTQHVATLRLGPFLYARGSQLDHWQKIIENPGEEHRMCHPWELNADSIESE